MALNAGILDPSIILQTRNFATVDPAENARERQQATIADLTIARANAQMADEKRQQEAQQAAAALQKKIGGLAAQGKYDEADQAALSGNDWGWHEHIANLREGDLKKAHARVMSAVPVAIEALKVPDIGQRAKIIQGAAPVLIQKGWTPEEIQAFISNPEKMSNQGLTGFIASLNEGAVAIKNFYEQQAEMNKPYTIGQYERRMVGSKEIARGPEPTKYQLDPETGRVVQIGGPGMGAGGAVSAESADVVYGHGRYAQPPMRLSTMPMGAVSDFQKNSLIPATKGKVGAGPDKGTGAVGTYQITYGTLKQYGPKVFGPNWRNVPFTAENQDALGAAIYNDVRGGDLHDTWQGLPHNAPGEFSNVPWEEVRGKIAQKESGGGAAPRGRMAGRPKEGYRWTDETRTAQEPIPGGPADPGTVEMPAPKELAKRNAAFPKVSSAYRNATHEIDMQIADLQKLRDHKGLNGIVGPLDARLPSILPNTTAAEALYGKIMARGQFRALQDMRLNSPTGGALGQVSDAENKTLRESVAAMKLEQGEESFKAAIEQYISDLQYAKNNIAQAYEDTYAYRAQQAQTPALRRNAGGGNRSVNFNDLPER